MTAKYLFSPPGETPNDIPNQLADSRVRLYTLDVTTNAEEGSIGVSTVTIEDPDGDFDIIGHRIFAVKETEVAAASNSYIYVGYTTDRKVTRGPYRTQTGRQWAVNLVDINTILERRVMVGADCNRPAETDVARVQWLVSTNEGHSIGDTRYLSTSGPVAMDAVDYRGQSFKSILDDCAQQSGKNYYLTYFGDTATTLAPWGRYSLWYDFGSSTAYSSAIRLSNDLADVDGVTTFFASHEKTGLTRDPSRVYSGVYMPYDGGVNYSQNSTTANNFARRDAVAPAENVKTNAKAQARAARYLADIATEEDVIATSFQVPAAKVNELREGMRVQAKFTHLPGYESPTWMRVLNRNVVQDSELTYTIAVELSPTGTSAVGAYDVSYVVAMAQGSHQAWTSIEASDDGVAWTPIIPDLSTGSIYANLWAISGADRNHRYWSLHAMVSHGGGAFGGMGSSGIRLLNAAGVDALHTQGKTPPPLSPAIDWPLRQPVVLTGSSVPYLATSNGDRAQLYGNLNTVAFHYVYPGPQSGDFTYATMDASLGIETIVVAAGPVDARWVWDLGA